MAIDLPFIMGAPIPPEPPKGRPTAFEAFSTAVLESSRDTRFALFNMIPGILDQDRPFTPLRNVIPRREGRQLATHYWEPSLRMDPSGDIRLQEISLVPFDTRQRSVRAYPTEINVSRQLNRVPELHVEGRAVTVDGEEVHFVHSAVRAMMQREEERLLFGGPAFQFQYSPEPVRFSPSAFEGLRELIDAGTVGPRIQVAETPAIYDPSNPDHCRAYVRKLHRQGHAPETIACWCPALTWGEIVDALG